MGRRAICPCSVTIAVALLLTAGLPKPPVRVVRRAAKSCGQNFPEEHCMRCQRHGMATSSCDFGHYDYHEFCIVNIVITLSLITIISIILLQLQ